MVNSHIDAPSIRSLRSIPFALAAVACKHERNGDHDDEFEGCNRTLPGTRARRT